MKRLAIATLLWLCAFAALAADLPKPVVSIEGVTEYRLPNGLKLLTIPDPSADTITVHIVYLVGSRPKCMRSDALYIMKRRLMKIVVRMTSAAGEPEARSCAAAIAAITVIAAQALPFRLSVPLAALAGIGAGLAFERSWR